ncbi:MAG: radical SAM protein [Blautia sp.]|nr:radical SAM protein [Blautia sp.]
MEIHAMKPSRYNIYDEENYSYIANTLTGCQIQVTKKEILGVKNAKITEFDKDELTILEDNGIIVDFELDEMQLLRNAYNSCKYTNKKATITIAPSLSCNFECVYCYENKNNEYMSEKTQNQVLHFLESLLTDNQISELNICWYGGEPLLQMDIIKKLSVEIIAFCNEKGIKYHASIITNGYLIDDEMVVDLKQCLIRVAQITIDGMEKTHDIRRKLISGKGTYKKIKNAIFLLAENDISVSVRVNLDKTNINEYKDVYDVFAKKRNIDCYPAIVTVEKNQSIDQQSCCYTYLELCEFYNEIFRDKYENQKRKLDIYIQPSINNCAAEHAYSYLIAPDGHLYKCLNDICDSRYSIGHVSGEICNAVVTAKYLGRDPFTEPECESCPYIPVCYGGCVYEYIKHDIHACKAVKYMYKKYCQKKMGGEKDESNYQKEN